MTEPARHKTPYLAAAGSPVARELKEAREALGLSVRDMAQALCIRSAHVEAIEEGRFDELPGRPYTLGFARSIARHLGLDADDVTQRLREEVMGTAPAVELVFPESTEDKRLSRTGWIVISLILAAGAYGAWLTVAHRDMPSDFGDVASLPQTIPDTPAPDDALTGTSAADGLSAAASAPEAAASPTKVEPAAEPAPVAAVPPEAGVPAAQEPSASRQAVAPEAADSQDVTPPPAAVVVTPAPPVAASAAPTAPAAQPAQDTGAEDVRPEPTMAAGAPAPRVVLHADQDSWIQIQSPDGGTVVARTLKAGESYTVPDRSGLKLTTGNAGGLEILVDGKPIPPLGQPGTVRRDIALDAARLTAGKALP